GTAGQLSMLSGTPSPSKSSSVAPTTLIVGLSMHPWPLLQWTDLSASKSSVSTVIWPGSTSNGVITLRAICAPEGTMSGCGEPSTPTWPETTLRRIWVYLSGCSEASARSAVTFLSLSKSNVLGAVDTTCHPEAAPWTSMLSIVTVTEVMVCCG